MHYDVADVQEMLTKISSAEPEKCYARPDWVWDSEYGDWIRTGCSYVHRFDSVGNFVRPSEANYSEVARAEAGCIIGKMLIEEVGIPMEWFDEGNERGQDITSVAKIIVDTTDHEFSSEAVAYMGIVQRAQDKGESWSCAVRKADRALEAGQLHAV